MQLIWDKFELGVFSLKKSIIEGNQDFQAKILLKIC
jgi:hypothetical protein